MYECVKNISVEVLEDQIIFQISLLIVAGENFLGSASSEYGILMCAEIMKEDEMGVYLMI